jgi:dienelactone hydrolase
MNPEEAMDRRQFLSTTLAATGLGASSAFAVEATSGATNSPSPAVAGQVSGGPRTRRWIEQRWLIDNVIKANGIDWDQARTVYLNAPCGFEANGDFAAIRQRVQKYADIAPAFEATARRREAKAKAAEDDGSPVTARDNYFMAAIHWGAAQWPLDENDEQNLGYNARKRECYTQYAKLADHHVEAVWIPYQGKQLPAWFHLPPGYQGGRLPAVVVVPGMDSFKEAAVALSGDRWLSRGMAVLAVEGPGQYECPVLGIYMSVPGWAEAGTLFLEWLRARPEVDPERIGITGTSFGSFASTVMAGAEPRYRAVAVAATALEPGFYTAFEEGSPTFKQRFMYMCDIRDEAHFEEFRKTLTWEGWADKIHVPYLCVAGELDELAPMAHTLRLIGALQGPKRLVVYQDSRHSVGGVPSTNLGPTPGILVSDWMAASLAGKSFASERWFVEANGRVTKTPF